MAKKELKCTLPEDVKQNFYSKVYETCLTSITATLPNGLVTKGAINEASKLAKRALKAFERQFSVEV